jgi:hypothetical protein
MCVFTPDVAHDVYPFSRGLSAGRVASRTGPTQNSHVDVATVYAYRPAPRRDERANTG